jgi:BirA family biotin operon repressor/biotin-[acetyl-CoA-carboxylase] ligase
MDLLGPQACATPSPGGGLEAQWGIAALRQALQRLRPGLQLQVVEEIDSTNAALLQALRQQAPQDAPRATLLAAQRQTAGRGRLGRVWHAQPGASLTFSLAWPLRRADLSGLSLAVGVTTAQALDPPAQAGGQRIALKWPNDLWLRDPGAASGGRKLGGILIETTGSPAQRWGVIGIGLNILPQTEGDFTTGQAWLREIDPTATPASTLACVAPMLLGALERFEDQGFEAFRRAFGERDLLRGRKVTTTWPALEAGQAEGVDETGRLLVRDAQGELHAVQAGEVSVRPNRIPPGSAGTIAQAAPPC